MKKLKISIVLLSVPFAILNVSCSTTKGFGQDLQKVGNRIETRADATGGTAPASSTGVVTPATPVAY